MATDQLRMVPCAGPGQCQHPTCNGEPLPAMHRTAPEKAPEVPEVVLVRCPNYGSDRPDAAYGPMPEHHARWLVDQFTDPGGYLSWTILPLQEGPPDA